MALRGSVACLLALLVTAIVEVPTQSAAAFIAGDNRGTKAAHLESGVFAFDMRRYDQVYLKANLTLLESAEIAVKSSRAREEYFHRRIHGMASNVSGKAVSDDVVYESPVYSFARAYVVEIQLGTPARTYVVIADTGSDLVWVKCAPCTTCIPSPDRIFDPPTSSSYRNLPCTNPFCPNAQTSTTAICSSSGSCLYEYDYGTGSSGTSGNLASETLTLKKSSRRAPGNSKFKNFVFGCAHAIVGDAGAADGLVGLSAGALSLVSQIGPRIGNVFSYCLPHINSPPTTTGRLLLGSPGPVRLRYTPLVINFFYFVNLVGITVNGVAVHYPADAFQMSASGGGGLIWDSGTTLTLLNSRGYAPLRDRLAALINYPTVPVTVFGLELCYDFAGVTTPKLPRVVFHFQNGLDMALPPANLFFYIEDTVACSVFQSSPFNVNILGYIQQQNFQVAFDRANHRLGLAPRLCS